MKSAWKLLLIGILGLTLTSSLVFNIRGTDFSISQDSEGLTETALQPAEVAKRLPTSDVRSGVLAESALVEAAYWTAVSYGMDRSKSLAELDTSSAIYTTYREFITFQSGEPGPGDFGNENPERPMFILTVTGSGFHPVGWLPNPFVPNPTKPSFYAAVIILFADTGEEAAVHFIIDGKAIPDLNELRFPSKTQTPEARELIPVPGAATPTQGADTLRGSS